MPAILFVALTAAVLVGACAWMLVLRMIVAIRRRVLHMPTPAPWWPPQGELMAAGASEEMAALIAAGQKIYAIKLYREEMGTGLYEAKLAIDGVLIRARTKRVMKAGGSEVMAAQLATRDNIEKAIKAAIKAYRQETG